jgi:methyl-accepting chemotaxis protein
MPTSMATALSRGTVSDVVQSSVTSLRRQLGDVRPSLLMVFASTEQPLERLLPEVAARFPGTTILGASTAGEFTQEGDTKGAVSIAALAGDLRVHAGMGLGLREDPAQAIDLALSTVPRSVVGYPHRTVLLLLDPLSGNGEEATLIAALRLGDGARLAGGAAGDDLKMVNAQVGVGDRVGSNAVAVAAVFSKAPFGVGVQHGHQSISTPMRVTRASGNVVFEIEGRPAWDVWAERTRPFALRRGQHPDHLAEKEVGAFLLQYEAGLATGKALKIRAPLSKNSAGALSFACGIPQGAEIQITQSDPERQIASAWDAAHRAHAQIGGAPIAGAIVFDCICRNLILGSRFGEALAAIHKELGGAPLAGFETYGEIALDAGDLSGFHNTTTVVLCVPRD